MATTGIDDETDLTTARLCTRLADILDRVPATEQLVDRYWTPPDAPPHLDSAYLAPRRHHDDPLSLFWPRAEHHVTSAEAAEFPCLVLLGPPGIGKSTELRRLYAAAAGPKCFVDLAEVTAAADLDRLIPSDLAHQWRGGGALFLDAFDEGRANLAPLGVVLARILQETDPEARLAIRIACRDADRPHVLEAALKQHYGSVRPLTLAPLLRSDAFAIAAVTLGDDTAQEFVADIERAGVQALAAMPLTLRLLVKVFQDEQRLPDSRAALFRRGLRRLAEETSPARRDADRTGHLSTDERVSLAARAAALLRFSGRTHLHLGVDEEAEPSALTASDLRGDERDGTAWARPALSLDRALRDLARHSGLLVGSKDTYRFFHLSVEEFLTADLLAREGTPPDVALALLSHPEAGLRPDLRETAAVLADLDPAFRDTLLDVDPSAALRYGVAGLDDPERERAVEAFLTAHDRGALGFWDRLPNADRLAHPALAAQLRRWIVDPKRYHAARKAALSAAQSARIVELAPLAIELALDSAQTPELGHLAALVALDLDPDAATGPLAPLATPEPGVGGPDSDRWVAFAVRGALFPHHLSANQLGALVVADDQPDASSNASSSAERFAQDVIADADLPNHVLIEGLSWIATRESFGAVARPVADALVEAAFMRASANTLLARGLARALLGPGSKSRYHAPFGWPPDSVSWDAPQADPARQAVAEAMVHILAAAEIETEAWDGPVGPLVHGFRLLLSSDVPFILGRLATEPSPAARTIWASALCRVFHLGPHTDAVLEACVATPTVWELYPIYARYFKAVETSGFAADEQRERDRRGRAMEAEQERERAAARPDPPTPVRVEVAVARVLAGEHAAWPAVTLSLATNPEREQSFRYLFHDDIGQAPTWSVLSAEQRGAVARAAHAFLQATAQSPGADARQVAAALRVLAEHDGALGTLTPDLWAAHAEALVRARFSTNTTNHTDRRADLLAAAYEHAPDVVRRALGRFVANKANTAYPVPTVLYAAARFWDGPLRQSVVDAVAPLPRAQGDAQAGREAVLEMLFIRHAPEAVALLLDDLRALAEAGLGRDPVSVWYAACSFLAAPSDAWPLLSDAVLSDDEYAEAFLRRLSHRTRGGLPSDVPPDVLSALYLRLHTVRPPTQDPTRPNGMFEWDTDHGLRDLRNTILNALTGQGTRAAVEELERISAAFPDADLRYSIRSAREQWARQDARFVTPSDVLHAVRDPNALPIRGDADLHAATLRVLAALQVELTDQEQAASPDLWNTSPVARPKGEVEISDYVARYLRKALRARGVAVSREAEVYQGSETDICLSASVTGDRDALVLLEVKGAWERGAVSGLVDQLARRYLCQAGHRHGVHLVVSFERALWDDADWRRSRRTDGPRLAAELDAQAEIARADGYMVSPIVLRVRAHKNAPHSSRKPDLG